MLLEIKPEYRALLQKSRNCVIDIPRSTPAHIRARLIDSSIALCERREIAPIEERHYQESATRFQASRPVVSDQTAIKRQIADWNKTHAKPSDTIDLRHGILCGKYKALSYDQIKRAVRLNYSEDTLNALNLAELGKQVRSNARRDGGQSADPTDSLRNGADQWDWDGDDEWDADKHRRAATYHRVRAQKASGWERGMEEHKCADLHDKAASASSRLYPYDNSRAARAASSNLLRLADIS